MKDRTPRGRLWDNVTATLEGWDVIPIEEALRTAGLAYGRFVDRLEHRGERADYSRTLRWVYTPPRPGCPVVGADDLEVRRAPDIGYQVRLRGRGETARWGHHRFSLDRVVAIVAARQDTSVDPNEAWRLLFAPDVASWVACPPDQRASGTDLSGYRDFVDLCARAPERLCVQC